MARVVVVEVDQLWAHSPATGGTAGHPLEEHLRATAELARTFAAPFGGGEVAYWLGALHDVGKAGCGWQDSLAEVAGTSHAVGIDHKSLGTRIAHERGLGGLAGAIFGHHGGLVDLLELGAKLKERLVDHAEHVASAEQRLPRLLPDLPEDLRPLIPAEWLAEPLVGEMAMRLCFSALVDADSLDTGAHFAQLSGPRLAAEADFAHLDQLYERRRLLEIARCPASPVDKLREQVYAECINAADRERGIFRLGAPTGAGKTIAAGGFAVRHARRHGMRRVIVAVPFLTITEQNADVYRRMLDEEGRPPVVLEHHSQVNFDDGSAGPWARLAAENWDAPFVVTTFVRLFESLFARKPSAMRRVHRLAGAVIVLDEVQALPHAMLAPILNGLHLLVKHFGATVLLSSATQPRFWALNELKGVDRTDLIRDLPKLVSDLRRVRYTWQLDEKPTLAQISEQAAAHADGALVIVNTTADAKKIFDTWRAAGLAHEAWHLSTRMCPDHRRRVLAEVGARLRENQRVLLVSTQLIEAGVDVSFPVVFRALAPADSLLQAAGRANREGRLASGLVVIFDPVDGSQPPAYKALVSATKRHFGEGRADPDDIEALQRYYPDVYDVLNLEDAHHVGQRIQSARTRWEFQTVAEGPIVDAIKGTRDGRLAFKMISDDGILVVCPQGASVERRQEVADLIEELRGSAKPSMWALRRLQPFMTSVHPSVLAGGRGVDALMRTILGTAVERGALVEWQGDYDEHTGMDLDPNVEMFIF